MTHKMKRLVIPAYLQNLILLPDLHIPKTDAHSLWLACNYGIENNADVIVLNGDVLDNTSFSRHGHKPQDEEIKKSFDKATNFFDLLRSKFPDALIYWTEGNHDEWFMNWIRANARQLQHDPYFSLQARLRLDEFGIDYVPADTYLKFGSMNICHGHQFFRKQYSGIVPAKFVFDNVVDNMIVSHVHRASRWNRKGLNGKQKTCYTTGCLTELSPNYSPFANYEHGFAHIYKKGRQTITRNLTIEKEIQI